jgi:non-ribosomal peptide synthetase component F
VVDVDGDADVVGWLGTLREQWIALRQVEHTPLVRIKEWSEVVGRRALFESVVCFDGSDYDTMLRSEGGEWGARRLDIFGQPDAPLTLNAYGGAALTLRITHDGRRIGDDAVARLLGQLRTVLEGFVARPGARLSDLPLLTEEEQRRLRAWNGTATDFGGAGCLHELFEAAVRTQPDAPAVTDGARTLSYAELDARAERLARSLRRRGVGAEVRVGLCLERSLDAVTAILGVSRRAERTCRSTRATRRRGSRTCSPSPRCR